MAGWQCSHLVGGHVRMLGHVIECACRILLCSLVTGCMHEVLSLYMDGVFMNFTGFIYQEPYSYYVCSFCSSAYLLSEVPGI